MVLSAENQWHMMVLCRYDGGKHKNTLTVSAIFSGKLITFKKPCHVDAPVWH